MGKVAFSHEGVQELHQLESSLLNIVMELGDLSQRLSTDAHAVESGLGVFSAQTTDMVDNIVKICKEAATEASSLQSQIQSLASGMEDCLNSL